MNNKITLIITWIALIGLGIFTIREHYNKPKMAFISIQETYNRFELRKELETKFIAVKNIRQKVLDSLIVDLQILAKKTEEEKGKNKIWENLYNKKQEEFSIRSQNYKDQNAQLSKEYDQEILSQLNQYISDYGKENNFQYIFGNDGNGLLMHADSCFNVTNRVIEYINEKYKGKK